MEAFKKVQIISTSVVTWCFILLSFWFFFFTEDAPLTLHKKVALLAQLLFLNVIHVSFTFGFLFGSKRGHDLINIAWKTSRKKIFGSLSFALILSTLMISYFVHEAYLTKTLNVTYIMVFQILLVVILPAHHRFKQTQGLFLSNFHKFNDKKTKEFVAYFRTLFPWCAILGLSINFLVRTDLISPDFELIKIILAVILSALASIMIFIELRITKSCFPVSLRFLLWPMSFFSDLALFGIIAIHGVEYFFVYLNLSLKDKSAHWISLVLGMLLVVAFIVRPLGGAGYGDLFSFTSVAILSGISYSLSLIHFYLDRKIFKMSDPSTRSIIGRHL